MGRLKEWARALKRETLALYYAARDPRTPWYARALAAVVVGYALSPIDLIPDFIPVLGLLDDLLLVPGAIWLVVRMIPTPVLDEGRKRAETTLERPTSRTAGVVIVIGWIACAVGFGALLLA